MEIIKAKIQAKVKKYQENNVVFGKFIHFLFIEFKYQ
jgi:hypothetical protein